MIWETPSLLFALWFVPLAGAAVVYAHRKRKLTASRFADDAMIRRLMPLVLSLRPWWKAGLLMVALAVLVIAAARPRFGVYFEKVSARGVDLFVLLDVSRSTVRRGRQFHTSVRSGRLT